MLKDLGLCYSEGCCGENTVWDDTIGACTTPITTAPAVETTEGFVPNSLNLCPRFNTGKTNEQLKMEDELAKQIKKEEPKSIDATGFDTSTFDPKTASMTDVRKKTKLDVQAKMKDLLNPTMDKINEITDSINDIEIEPINTDELNDLGDEILGDSVPGEGGQGKCYFTTMEDAHEISGCGKVNRVVYYPSENNELLPTNTFLDNEVYYKGLNHSKELTNHFSNYK